MESANDVHCSIYNTFGIIERSERHMKSVDRVWISLCARTLSGNAGQIPFLYGVFPFPFKNCPEEHISGLYAFCFLIALVSPVLYASRRVLLCESFE
jgi:hypothetical protein